MKEAAQGGPGGADGREAGRERRSIRWREALAQLRHLPAALGLCRAAAPGLAALWFALLLLSGVLPLATVLVTREFVNGLSSGGGGRAALVWLALLAAALLLGELLRTFSGLVRVAQAEKVRDHVAGLIQERSVAADLAFYETPSWFDHLHRAREEARHRPLALLQSVGGLLQNGVTFLAMAAVLFRFGALMPAALLLSTLPALWVVLARTVRFHRWRRLRTADERRALWLDHALSDGRAAAEVRLFGLGAPLRRRWAEIRGRLREERIGLARGQALAEGMAGAFGLAVSAGAFLLLTLRAVEGAVGLGDLAMFWLAFWTGQRLLRGLLSEVGQVYSGVLFLGDLFEFLALEPAVRDPDAREPAPGVAAPALAFRSVSFRYPGAERPVLTGFSFEVPAGRITALVGENGCGKSTLVKLLCRLYDPDRGTVEMDGTDVRRFALADLRRRITALFQEPVHWSATAGDNIVFGDTDRPATVDRLAEAARAAGAEEILASLPRGADTLLGKWFPGGAELSLGEWQRIALARALYREAPVLVLDEPTSAMDSWAEGAWMDRFRDLVRDRTVLLITHRFTTARRADAIHVMEAGRIVESGTHESLLAAGGRYASAWRNQTGG